MSLSDEQVREKLRSALLDKKYIEKIFQLQKQALSNQKIRIDTIRQLNPNDAMIQILAKQAERQNEDMDIIMEYLEIICLNVSEVVDLAISTSRNLIDSKIKLEDIKNNMNQSLNDLESLKENKPTIDFITKQLKEQAEDISPE